MKLLTNYHHEQNRPIKREISVNYCLVMRDRAVRTKSKIKPSSLYPHPSTSSPQTAHRNMQWALRSVRSTPPPPLLPDLSVLLSHEGPSHSCCPSPHSPHALSRGSRSPGTPLQHIHKAEDNTRSSFKSLQNHVTNNP